MYVFNNEINFSEVYAMAMSMTLNTGVDITRGGIFTFFSSALLNNSTALTWTKRNSAISTIEYCKDVVTFTGGSELLSVPLPQNEVVSMPIIDLDFYFPPLGVITLGFKPFQNYTTTAASAADISFSVSWIQR